MGNANVDVLDVGTRQYGFARGGEWHEVACESGMVAEGLVELL